MKTEVNIDRSGEAAKCVAILGGSFNPVHTAHITLAELFCHLLKPDQLRIVPSGWSWQKMPFQIGAHHRIAMLSLAFASLSEQVPLVIDTQEIKRAELGLPSYSVDTLNVLRGELGDSASLVLLMGADQLQQLQTWHHWPQLFELAHIVVAARPGAGLDAMDPAVASEFHRRSAGIEQIRNTPSGCTYFYPDLAINISSTEIRNGKKITLVPPDVLDYINQHHLY